MAARIYRGPVLLKQMELEVSLNCVRFSQDTIKPYLEDTHLPLEDAVSEIVAGNLRPEEFPKLKVRKYRDLFFTHNNRCLWVFKKAGLSRIVVLLETVKPAASKWNYMTFEHSELYDTFSNPEYFPRVRGYCLADCHLLNDKSTVPEPLAGTHSSMGQDSRHLNSGFSTQDLGTASGSAAVNHSPTRKRSWNPSMRSSEGNDNSDQGMLSLDGDKKHLNLKLRSSSYIAKTPSLPTCPASNHSAKGMGRDMSPESVDEEVDISSYEDLYKSKRVDTVLEPNSSTKEPVAPPSEPECPVWISTGKVSRTLREILRKQVYHDSTALHEAYDEQRWSSKCEKNMNIWDTNSYTEQTDTLRSVSKSPVIMQSARRRSRSLSPKPTDEGIDSRPSVGAETKVVVKHFRGDQRRSSLAVKTSRGDAAGQQEEIESTRPKRRVARKVVNTVPLNPLHAYASHDSHPPGTSTQTTQQAGTRKNLNKISSEWKQTTDVNEDVTVVASDDELAASHDRVWRHLLPRNIRWKSCIPPPDQPGTVGELVYLHFFPDPTAPKNKEYFLGPFTVGRPINQFSSAILFPDKWPQKNRPVPWRCFKRVLSVGDVVVED